MSDRGAGGAHERHGRMGAKERANGDTGAGGRVRGAGGARESKRQQRRRGARDSERRHGCRGAKERANGDTGDGVTNA
jgi:hypothetical protein